MSKIIDFFRENWIGGVVGGVPLLLISWPILLDFWFPLIPALLLGMTLGAFINKSARSGKYLYVTLAVPLYLAVLLFMIAPYGVIELPVDLPYRCNFEKGLQCLEYEISKDRGITFTVRNNYNDTILLNSVTFKNLISNEIVSCLNQPSFPMQLRKIESVSISSKECSLSNEPKDKIGLSIELNYLIVNSLEEQVAHGEIFTSVGK